MDPVGTLRIISAWLRDWIASEVSPFVFWRLADVCRCDLDLTASMDGGVNPMETFQRISVWLRGVCAR